LDAATPEWIDQPLCSLDREQWEALCDGCAKCCLHKVQDENDSGVRYTNVACRLLNLDTCRCSDYPNRRLRVPDCVSLDVEQVAEFGWLPKTCAYRLRAAGRPLPSWHPLLSCNTNSVHESGASIRAWAVSECQVCDPDDIEAHATDIDL